MAVCGAAVRRRDRVAARASWRSVSRWAMKSTKSSTSATRFAGRRLIFSIRWSGGVAMTTIVAGWSGSDRAEARPRDHGERRMAGALVPAIVGASDSRRVRRTRSRSSPSRRSSTLALLSDRRESSRRILPLTRCPTARPIRPNRLSTRVGRIDGVRSETIQIQPARRCQLGAPGRGKTKTRQPDPGRRMTQELLHREA